ncbi:response regulator [Pontibacter qinzhouensis]|uniref:histidine kinase n=1 Tax=Pontibacter qinzhouensis TaxID=2603253 RepID=A0A5C8JGP9_9BACT|nr:two-component regulator propeller domain-containing protein [Pontibacter qinzhouensis]TXK37685.1 response regulator [Pontibacter qinzhouensis]
MNRSNIIGFLLFVVLLTTTTGVSGQVKCKIERYTTEDGLSHDNVTSTLKDRDGFMWLGTWDGINRFDGHNFIAYKSFPGDNSKLKNNRIESIVEDDAGFLWLKAYDNNVYRFDKRTEQFYAIGELLEKQGLRNIVFDNVILGKKGIVWLTTSNQGLFYVLKSTSAKPEIYRYANAPIIGPDNNFRKINFLFTDKANTAWAGTTSGLCRFTQYDGGTIQGNNIRLDMLDKLNFTSFAEGTDKIWFGTSQGYLVVYDKKANHFRKQKICNSSINSVCLSNKRNVLYLTNSNRQLLTARTSDLQTAVASLPGKAPFLSVFEDNTGLVWIEPEDQGAIKFDPADQSFRHFTQPKDATFHPSFRVFKVFEDHKKRVWVSMQGGGFGYYDPTADSVKYFYNKPGSSEQLFSNFVTSSFVDASGVMWLCTNDRGINKIIFQDEHFKNKMLVPNTPNKSDNEVRGVFHDSKNRLWLSSKSGHLFVYNNGELVPGLFHNVPRGGLGNIYTIIEDSKKNIWLGTKGAGLFKAEPVDHMLNQYKLIHFQFSQDDSYSLNSNMIHTVIEDSKGRIWVGTFGAGLNLIEQKEGKVRFLNDKNSFHRYPKRLFKRIRHLNEGPAGDIWVATTDGLLIFNPDEKDELIFDSHRKIPGNKASLGNNDVQYILRDSKNGMWLCTSGGGLNKAIADHGSYKFRVYTKEEGLPNDYLLSAVEDDSGKLWLVSENGISRFDPETEQFRNYDSYDGLPKAGFSEAAAIRLGNGNLLFGSKSGYLVFNPAEITNKKIAANMVFTNFQVNNRNVEPAVQDSPLKLSINHTEKVELAFDQNMLGLEFTVLDFHSGSRQGYAYRLKGYDAQWHQVKDQHKAIYTNLPPGKYMFEVKSLNTGVYETIPSKKLAITIHPPVWRTTWAYIIYTILVLILLEIIRRVTFSMIKLRNRIAIEQKLTDLKLRFFTNISHELRTPLTLIVNPIEAIASQEELSPKGREYINVVRKNTGRMVRFINQLLDFRKAQGSKMKLNIERTEIVALVREICEHFTEAAAEKQILLHTTSNVKEFYAWIDTEKIDTVLYNLLSNALKFTPNGKVITVEIICTANDSLTLKVIDQGIGVPNDKLSDIFELYYEVDKLKGNNIEGTGIGLALAKEFVELHHGKITAQNNATAGLTVAVSLQTGKEHYKEEEILTVGLEPVDNGQIALPAELLTENASTDTALAEQAGLQLVLLVEDNSELRRFLADQLKAAYRVEEAEDGEEGLVMAMRLLPDLVISDIMMPKMDGIQLLDKLKNIDITSHIPVILLTARTSVEYQIEGLNYGADYYITKPFQTDFIRASVKNLLARRKKIFDALLSGKKILELKPSEIIITSNDEAFLTKIIQIVESGMSDPEFNIDAVAENIGMGRTTFYRKFTSLTNLAPVEFVRDMRLQRGKQLLDVGEGNVTEIASSIGFSSAGYFSTCFKKKFSLTPTEYLKTSKVPHG